MLMLKSPIPCRLTVQYGMPSRYISLHPTHISWRYDGTAIEYLDDTLVTLNTWRGSISTDHEGQGIFRAIEQVFNDGLSTKTDAIKIMDSMELAVRQVVSHEEDINLTLQKLDHVLQSTIGRYSIISDLHRIQSEVQLRLRMFMKDIARLR